MTYLRYFLLVLAITFSVIIKAQNTNVFLKRDYWKSNPSISEIEHDIEKGNDISELNSNAFDAVTYALIEKVDNKTIEHLLSKKGNDVNKITHDGRTYIFWAAYKGNISMMKYLLKMGAKTDVIDDHGYTVFNFAAATGQLNTQLYDFLLEKDSKLIYKKDHNGANALLLIAPYFKDLEIMDYFLDKGIKLESIDNNGNNVFNYASKGGNIKILDKLIKLGVTHRTLNKVNGNAMLFANRGTRGHTNTLELYKYLESVGVQPNIVTRFGENPLHRLSYRSKDIDVINFFLEKGVNPNEKDKDGNTPFMNASYTNSLEIIKLLENKTTDINTVNKKGESPLFLAVKRNSVDVVLYLIEKGAKVSSQDSKGNSLAFYLINGYKNSDKDVFNKKLEILLKNGLDINKTQGNGQTLIHLAVEKDNLELLKLLHQFTIDINAKNNDGLTPLHLAAMKAKNTDILKYLIAKGANRTIKTDFGESLHDLAKENEILQKNNIDITFLK